ncbi:E3 ubiquitin-protein ligase RNF19A-like isoform X2 [Planococcus citri]|uniref:E3 ubiquitin-protein ligase RNF19A-like isoform X2 n=1 Tax=Planococcus citri TaxID=170843 RepID=UPI0031F89C46
MDCKMDKHKSRRTKHSRPESAGSSSETATENQAQITHKPVKKKRSKKGGNDGDHNSGRFSFRYLLYNNPLYPQRFRFRNRKSVGTSTAELNELEKGISTEEKDASNHSEKSACNKFLTDGKVGRSEDCKLRECPLCLADLPIEFFPKLISCQHRSCIDCYQQYLRIEISESRVNVMCPECPESLHPNDIRMVLNDPVLFEKYEDFTLRRILAVDPDTRWCPAPDCGYAVIASGCASCPKLRCERPGCGSYFCYHCKAAWHPNQTCDSARAERSANLRTSTFSRDSQSREDIKCCPICRVLIVKMDDGSCNHMTCAVCGAEFCWLCMNVVGDLHYLSPSGCTFWGKKPWSRKKKILWQLGILVGAPVGIALIAGIAVPAIIIGVPIWTGRKMYTRFLFAKRCRRNTAIVTGVITAILAAPILATLAVAIGVPILLFYVYGVVPVSLCRSSGCGVTASSSGVRLDFDEPEYINQNILTKVSGGSQGTSTEADVVSHKEGNPSIGEASLSLGSGTHLEHLGRELDRESASTVALAGSILAHKLEVLSDAVTAQNACNNGSETASDRSDVATSSTRALHGSLLNYKTSESSEDGIKLEDVVTVNPKSETNEGASSKPSPSRNLLRNLFFNLTSTATAMPIGQTSSKTIPSTKTFQATSEKTVTASLPSVSGISRKKIIVDKGRNAGKKSPFF